MLVYENVEGRRQPTGTTLGGCDIRLCRGVDSRPSVVRRWVRRARAALSSPSQSPTKGRGEEPMMTLSGGHPAPRPPLMEPSAEEAWIGRLLLLPLALWAVQDAALALCSASCSPPVQDAARRVDAVARGHAVVRGSARRASATAAVQKHPSSPSSFAARARRGARTQPPRRAIEGFPARPRGSSA